MYFEFLPKQNEFRSRAGVNTLDPEFFRSEADERFYLQCLPPKAIYVNVASAEGASDENLEPMAIRVYFASRVESWVGRFEIWVACHYWLAYHNRLERVGRELCCVCVPREGVSGSLREQWRYEQTCWRPAYHKCTPARTPHQ